ncbi:hypothetical protein RP20_CCG000009 [Aedes albopictus]|nr:hypothetical protein RP20_CCG000009 [Aedes albopictus]
MAAVVEEAVFNALRGHHNEKTKLPSPRIIKIYVASLKEDFKEERRLLLEVIGPDLQSVYDDRQIEVIEGKRHGNSSIVFQFVPVGWLGYRTTPGFDHCTVFVWLFFFFCSRFFFLAKVEIVDIHFGTGSGCTVVDLDPYVLDDHLYEIETCHRVSKSVFLIVLLGSRLGNFLLPTKLDSEVFTAINKHSTADECECLRKWYQEDAAAGGYVLRTQFRTKERQEWITESRQLSDILENKIDEILKAFQDGGGGGGGEAGGGCGGEEGVGITLIDSKRFCDNLKRLKTRALELEIQKGLACSKENMLAVFRQWDAENGNGPNDESGMEQIKSSLREALPADNQETLTAPWTEGGIDPELDSHESYLNDFKELIYDKLKNAIDQSLAKEPNGGKGRKKTVQRNSFGNSLKNSFKKALIRKIRKLLKEFVWIFFDICLKCVMEYLRKFREKLFDKFVEKFFRFFLQIFLKFLKEFQRKFLEKFLRKFLKKFLQKCIAELLRKLEKLLQTFLQKHV